MYYDLYFFSYIYFLHLTFIHLADALSKATYIEEYIGDYIIRGKQTQEVLVIQISRQCSEQILARQ